MFEYRIPGISALATGAAFNTKAIETERKYPDITSVAIKATYNSKATEVENKIFETTCFMTTPDLNRLT